MNNLFYVFSFLGVMIAVFPFMLMDLISTLSFFYAKILPPLLKVNSSSSSRLILEFLSILKVLLKNYLAMFDTPNLIRISSILSFSIFLISYFSFLAFQGVSPISIS